MNRFRFLKPIVDLTYALLPRSWRADFLVICRRRRGQQTGNVNEEKKLLKNGQTPGGGQSEPSNWNGSILGAGTNGGQTKGGASPKSGGETDGKGAGKPTKGASSQTSRPRRPKTL